MTQPWWNTTAILNKLRLRTVRKRGMHHIHEKWTQPECQQQLLHVLERALNSETREQAVAYVASWFQAQISQSRESLLWSELWQELKPILEESSSSPSHAAVSSASYPAARSSTYQAVASSSTQYSAVGTSSPSRTGLPQVPASPFSSFSTKVSGASSSLPTSPHTRPGASPSQHQATRSHHPLPSRRETSSSSHESLSASQETQSSAQFSSPSSPSSPPTTRQTQHHQPEPHRTERSTPSSPMQADSAWMKRLAEQNSRDRAQYPNRHPSQSSTHFRDTSEQKRPSAEELRASSPSSSSAEMTHPRSPSSSAHPRVGVSSSSHPQPTQTGSSTNNPRPTAARGVSSERWERPVSSPSIPNEQQHPSTSSGFWLPSTAVESENVSDSLDDLEFGAWWDTPSVLESLRLRLQRRNNAAQLNLLLNHAEFTEFLSHTLNEGALLPNIQEAQKHVRTRLLQLQQQTPQNNWSDALWSVLVPLLKLRQRYSGAFNAIPSAMAQQIEQSRENVQQYIENQAKKPSLYDWENDNRDWILYINNVVGKITHKEDDEG